MGKFNDIVLKSASWFNFIYSILGVAILGVGIYLVSANLGASFFISGGIFCILFGLIVFLTSWVGSLGFNYQLKSTGNTYD